jgi:pimeloyl-ACP methyl ester carboxylesterase
MSSTIHPPVTDPALSFLDPGNGPRLAFRLREGADPMLLFLPGYASDMEGSKAAALDDFANRRGLALLRFDYSGSGSSEGRFDEGTLERWLGEATLMLDELTNGPVILVGSSMGGWIALHLAARRPQRVAALVGIAAAPDFTQWGYTDEEKTIIRRDGRLERPNPYAPEPQVTSRNFWESGQDLLVLESEIPVDCPVRLIHGDRDEDVPFEIALRLKDRLRSADVQVSLVKGGGHRLSAPHEIDLILRAVAALVEPFA